MGPDELFVGERPRGKLEQASVDRQARDLERWPARSPEECDEAGFWFDEEAVERIAKFFGGYLCHYQGRWAGSPVILEDWQLHDVLGPVFGWKHRDGTRRYRVAYVEIPRKNGKSLTGGGVALYMLVADGEAGAEVYSAATKKDQAAIVWLSGTR